MQTLVPWWGILPFAVMLLSIALLPMIPLTSRRWEDWRFQLFISLVLGIPVALWVGLTMSWIRVAHALVEYGQFILLLFSLFVVSGGIFLSGDIRPTPKNNTIVLAIGALASSFIGTTGAAMLLIRPLIKINAGRRNSVHTIIFTILIVANSGGLLTPLGDPPLFLGFLRGVPFTWTFHLLPMWAFINGLLLLLYFSLDSKAYAQERPSYLDTQGTTAEPIRILGLINIVWFIVIIGAVALAPSIDLGLIESGQAHWTDWVPWREIAFLIAALGSYLTSSSKIRFECNRFSWDPIAEVSVIFIGVFLTMIPALEFLGEVAHTIPLNTPAFFVFTGMLSAFLDNAPTYATFFEMAHALGSDPTVLAGEARIAGVPSIWLEAISLGAVTCGAVSYIGNGPNFMVKSVAESAGISMPSFGHYILWAVRHLIPTLAAMVLLFLVDTWWGTAVGLLLTAILITGALLTWLKSRDAQC